MSDPSDHSLDPDPADPADSADSADPPVSVSFRVLRNGNVRLEYDQYVVNWHVDEDGIATELTTSSVAVEAVNFVLPQVLATSSRREVDRLIDELFTVLERVADADVVDPHA